MILVVSTFSTFVLMSFFSKVMLFGKILLQQKELFLGKENTQ